jgi:molybdenum cofactor biosynthesis protein MoaC
MSDPKGLSHVDARGGVRMVDVSAKPATRRSAVASALVRIGPEAFERLRSATLKKGDALTTAQIAGILAAKRTPEMIPLCHGLCPAWVDVRCELRVPDAVVIRAEAGVEGKTGVELEALMAASIAALTIYDMCKAVSQDIVIGPLQLEEKHGGRSGSWRRSAPGT